MLSPTRGRLWLLAALVATTALAACDRPSDVADPSEIVRQHAPGGNTTTLTIKTVRADNPAIAAPYTTVSLYWNSVQVPVSCDGATPGTNCRAITDENGIYQLEVPSNVGMGYLARHLWAGWADYANAFVFPLLLPAGTNTDATFDDLDALTCARSGPIAFNRGRLSNCLSGLFFTPRGISAELTLPLPVVNTRSITVKGPDGNADPNAYITLVSPTDAIPWAELFPGTNYGLIRGIIRSGGKAPGVNGLFAEVYYKRHGLDFAGTTEITSDETTIGAAPTICADPDAQGDVRYLDEITPSAGPDFTFTQAKYAYAAVKLATLLKKDSTVAVMGVDFAQAVPVSITFSVKHRIGTANYGLSATVQCAGGSCDTQNATYNVPTSSGFLSPQLFQSESGRLFLVVSGLNKTGTTEWRAQAVTVVNKKTIVLDQVPRSSKSGTSSADLLLSKDFNFCHPDHSHDGGWTGLW